MDGQQPMTKEQLQQYAEGSPTTEEEPKQEVAPAVQPMAGEEEANRKPTALSRVPLDEKTGEPMFEKADKETALDALNEVTGGNEANTTAIVNAQVEQAQKVLDTLKKKQPTKKAPALKGSPMAMLKAQQEADANYNAAMEQYNGQVAQAEETLNAWSRIYALMNERKRAIREQQEAEQRERDQKLHDEAVAQVEEQKRIAAEKAAEQAEVGTHAVNPKIKEKWEGAAKVEGNANAITLADGSTIRGHYVLTEAGAASASHDVSNAFEPTEGFPIDENGESVNDRDYKRDTDAQRIVRDIAQNYDSRALQSPVIVSKDGIVLSGNNRTMSGDMAAAQGTDKAYIDHLREFGEMYGFTPEQIDGMKHPRVVFVPDEAMPYDATTFARFNAEQQKKQGKDAQAVKLGKVVPDNVFNSIVGDISRYDRLSDFYADDKAVASAISQLLGAGVINEMQLPEMRTGNALSAAGRELIENTLIGKVFQTSPDAVRQIISTPTLRHAVIMGLNEIAHNRTLAKSGYDLSQELGAAVDLVARAKAEAPDIYKEGMPVSPYGRQAGLFDDEYGDSRVTDATVLLLADVLNSGKPSDLRKMLATYNNEAQAPASGQIDMFSGDVRSKEQLLNDVNEYFRNATPREQQAIVDAAVAERKQRAEANSEAGNVTGRSERSANRQGVGGLQEEARDEVANQAMSHDEAIAFIAAMENRAEVAPSVDLSIENWDALFGKDGIVNTPIGEVKMGDNQFTKMMREDRHGKLGMVKPTLENPDVILEDASKAKEDDTEERPSSYIFVKAFKKADGSRYYYFASITVSKDGREVVVSNQEKRKNAIANLLSKDRLVWKHADDVSDASDVAQGLYSSQGNVSDLATEGTDAPQTSMSNNIWSASEVQNDNSAVASDGLQSEPIADNDSTSNGTPSKKGKLQNRFDGGAQTERHPADVSVTTSPGIMQGNDIVWPEPTVGSNASTDTAEVVDSPTEVAKGETVDRGGNSSQPISSVDKVINNQSDLQENSEKSPANEGETSLSEKIAEASAGVNTEPSEAQKEAGNYKKGHVQVGTFDITIEQPQGSVRRGTDANGKQWESKMHNTYGYFRGTEGVDGDHIDVFLSNDIDGWNGRKVYVVDQYNPDGTFDEHKVMLGFNDMGEAKSDYLANYEKGWEDGRRITVSATNLEDFEKWIDSSHRKTKPFAEYAGVKKETVANAPAKGETKGYSITPTTYTNKKGKTSDVSDTQQSAHANLSDASDAAKVGRKSETASGAGENVADGAANERFNSELTRYQNGEMDKNEMLHLGRPQGVMRAFLPNLPIVMRQRILAKGSIRKHNVAIEALADMPNHLSHPIFVFKRSDNALGVLTEMQDRDGKNVCVAIELNRHIQNGGEILEVNDIRSVHGRNVADIIYPIVQNGTLKWADKEKGLAYLSSASRYVQQEIDKQDLDTAAKVVKDFTNPNISDENISDEGMKFRLLEDDDPKAMELEALPESELVPVYRNVQAFEDDALGSPMAFTDAETGERRTLQGGKWNASAQEDIELTPDQQRQLDELNKNGYIVVDGKKTNELKINNSLFFKKGKTGDAQLQYWLKKNPEDSGVPAAYDPYDHAIETPLNTQFGTAYKRPNLVVVRSLIPKTEIDEPYHAKYALLPTGAHDWNNGRTLYLSRWSKIDKVLTREEEARMIDEYWKKNPGKREALKSHRDYNRFVPQVRRELEKMGYRFELDGRELTPEESLALDEQNWENRDVIPGREGHIPFISNDDIARINAKMSGKWVGEPKEAMENAMTARVNELAESLNTPVRIVRTDAEVAALPSARQRRMKGSFNPLTGEVTIVVPNNANLADVENTFVHEVVGHDGLRVLFPEKEKLDNALDELYRVSNTGIQQTIDRMAQKMYDAEVDRLREKKRKAKGEDTGASYYADMAEAHAEASKKREQFRREATEEYGADLAGRIGESGFEKMSAEEQTFWGKLKAMLQKALQKLLEGLKIPGKKKWSDKEWAFVLHEAYKRKKNGGNPTVFDAADTEVMRRKTRFGETKFSDGHKKSAQPNEAALKHLEPIDVEHAAKVLQRREKAKERLANVAKAYKNTTNSKGFISDLSNSLGLMRGSTGSGYGSFETPNGKVFTIRVSNHNINAANVGNEPVESIVIKTKRSPNRFHAEDGKYANEYVYFKEDIRQAPAGTLSSIAESISELLDTGEYHDKTGLAKDKHSPETDPDKDIMFRDGDSEEYNKAMARDTYERRVIRGMYQTQEALQDSMLGLKEAMDAILKAEGNGKTYIEEVAGYENAYLGENRLSSTNQAECAEFARRLFKPMLEEVAGLAKTADERAELTDYMMAKHGLERNEVMARRAAAKVADAEFGADIRKAERAVNKDPLDQDAADRLDELRQKRDDREQDLYMENRTRDYSGLTALTGKDNVADAEAEARGMVMDYELWHTTSFLWDRVNAVTKATLQKTYESGLINKATYEDIKGMYTHYIPLRGFDDKTSDEAYAYLADKHSAFNAPMKTAKGRKSKADDPFANMEAMAESAIMQGNRNTLVKQKFLNFALNHPSDLVSVSDLWLRYDDVKDEWMPVNSGDIAGTEKLEEDDSAAEVERKMRDFEDAMEQAAKNDPAHFKKQKDAPDIPYRVVESRDLRQHQVLVKRNGKDYLLTINGNPRAAQALNGQTNPDNDVSGAIGAIMHLGESVNRQLSAFYTTRNPDFVVSNFMRDMLYSNSMVWVKESPNYAWRYNWNVAKVNPAKMKILLAKLRNGTLDMNDETEKMFKLFIDNGGETGYANIRDIDQRKNDIKREVKKMNGKLPIHQAWDLLSERLDDYSRAVELCARFAAFKTSREMGRTIDRSIYDAKEISVNFNKKGSGAKFMGAEGQTKAGNAAAMVSGLGRSFYVFWNAGIQGTTNFGRQAKRHPKKAIAGVAAMFMLGALMAYLGGDDGDDDGNKDAYYNLPEYVRRSNVVFRLPGMDKSWIALPLPVEYRAMYGMGELAVSVMSGKEHYTGGELAHAMASQVSQMMPLDLLEGSGGFKPFVPSAVKPFAEVLTNESWTGMPIYKDTPYNKDDPEWTKAYKSANPYLVGMSKWLNERTGGDRYTKGKVDINPAKVEYLLNGYFGGLSRSVDELVKMGETATGGMEYDPKNMMFMNRVIKRGDERTEYRAVNEEYWKIREESEALRKRLNHYEMDTADGVFDYAEKIAWLNNSPEYRVLETYEKYSGDVTGWSEALAYATRRGYTKRAIEANEMLNEAKARLVHEVEKARAGKR